MTTRRMAYWWLKFVFSGRFLETFLVVGMADPPSLQDVRHRRLRKSGVELLAAVPTNPHGRSAADQSPRRRDCVTAFPGKIGQASAQGAVTA